MRGLADAGANGSFSNSRRTRRFEAFARILEGLREQHGRPVHVLDIGGTNSFWEQRGFVGRADIQVVVVNLEAERRMHENIEPRAGDATNLSELPMAPSTSCSATR
jgi:hypothetical protein